MWKMEKEEECGGIKLLTILLWIPAYRGHKYYGFLFMHFRFVAGCVLSEDDFSLGYCSFHFLMDGG